MAQALSILVGTMTGTADLVAQEVEASLGQRGIAAAVIQMDGLNEQVFAEGGLFLICTSTYGQGDVPDNARDFVDRLEAARPDLSAIRFGLVALGDRTYATTYCHGGLRFDTLLSELGARRVGEMFLHDASEGTMAEDEAVAWVDGWIDDAMAASGAT
jgi:MioC protein